MTAKPAVEPAKGPEIPVNSRQLEQCRTFVSGKLKALILECSYGYQPGSIAGALADLKALHVIVATDSGTNGIVAGPAPEPADIAARRQEAAKAREQTERKRLGGVKS